MSQAETADVLVRIGQAAHRWSTDAGFTRAQQAMARALEIQAAKLAAQRETDAEALDDVMRMTCCLYAVALGGAKPDPQRCPFRLCAFPQCVGDDPTGP